MINTVSGQAIPAGLHVRMSMKTGEKEAKLMDGDSGMKYWKTGDKEGIPLKFGKLEHMKQEESLKKDNCRS